MSVALDRRKLLWAAFCCTATAFATTAVAATPDTTAPVEQLHAGLIEIMKAGKTAPFRQRYEKIAPVIGRSFDLEAIVRQVIGTRWSTLPPEQQAALTDAF